MAGRYHGIYFYFRYRILKIGNIIIDIIIETTKTKTDKMQVVKK